VDGICLLGYFHDTRTGVAEKRPRQSNCTGARPTPVVRAPVPPSLLPITSQHQRTLQPNEFMPLNARVDLTCLVFFFDVYEVRDIH
jgi:hypothetical protein